MSQESAIPPVIREQVDGIFDVYAFDQGLLFGAVCAAFAKSEEARKTAERELGRTVRKLNCDNAEQFWAAMGKRTDRAEAAEAELTQARTRIAELEKALTDALADVAYVPGDHPIVPVKYDRFVKAVRALLRSLQGGEDHG